MQAKTAIKSVMASSLGTIWRAPERSLAVLTYHSIGEEVPGSESVAVFKDQLAAISSKSKRHSFDWAAKGTAPTLSPAYLVTFDDGYRDNFEIAAPILDDHGVRALFFISTAFIESQHDITKGFRNYRGLKPMSWEQLGNLAERGHSIGLHGHTHRNFATMSPAEAADEIGKSNHLIRRRLGHEADSFAYPFGQYQHRRPDIVQMVSGTKVQFIFTTDHNLADLDCIFASASITTVPRLRVDPSDSSEIVLEKMRGEWDYVARIQRIKSCIAMRSPMPVVRNDR